MGGSRWVPAAAVIGLLTGCSNGLVTVSSTGPTDSGSCDMPCSGKCIGGRCLVTLASGQNYLRSLAVDSTGVYWTTLPCDAACQAAGGIVASAVMKIPLVGGTPVTLATSTDLSPIGLVADSTSVYWTESNANAVMKVPAGGGTPVTFATDYVGAGLAVDATNLYYGTDCTGTTSTACTDVAVIAVPKAGGPSVTLASQSLSDGSSRVMALALNREDVFFTTKICSNSYGTGSCGGNVVKEALGGGTATTLVSAQPFDGPVAADPTGVYWLMSTSMCPDDGGPCDSVIARMPASGGTPVGFAEAPDIGSIALDATSLYFTSQDSVMKADLGGGTPVTLATGQTSAGALVVDATSVYWTTETDPGTLEGTVMKLTPK